MAAPITTVVPFTALPSCATSCGALYDANGACVPPAASTAAATVYDSCFCSYDSLQAFSTGTAGVCDSACTADTGGLSSIQSWFTSFCAANKAVATSSATATSASNAGSGSGNDGWLSSHWRWVIMIIIVVVGIIGIWVGACIWRRKYLKKKDRLYELGKGLPSTQAVNTQGNLIGPGVNRAENEPGVFMPGAAAAQSEKPKGKKWKLSRSSRS